MGCLGAVGSVLGIFNGSVACRRSGRESWGAVGGSRRFSIKGDWSFGGFGLVISGGVVGEGSSCLLGTTIEPTTPPKNSDNRSEAVWVGNGGSGSTFGWTFGGEGVGGEALALLGAGVRASGNDIRATSIARKGSSIVD